MHYHVTCILNGNLFSGSIRQNFSTCRGHNVPLYLFEVEGASLHGMSWHHRRSVTFCLSPEISFTINK